MRQSQAVAVDDVFHAELDEISLRRRKAGLHAGKPQPRTRESESSQPVEPIENAGASSVIEIPTVGLALSGGGIRSGSLGIGFLQALYRRGILRHVDFLSTVSGGGYAGAFFSSLLMDNKLPSINWIPKKEHLARKRLDLIADPSGKQPRSLSRLLYAGQQLRDPVNFLSHWFIGALFLNLWALSGLIAAAALFAFVFRLPDLYAPMLFLKELGVVDDAVRAFLFPLIGSVAWLMLRVFSAKWRSLVSFQGPMFIFVCVLWALGFFTFLTIADNATPTLEKSLESPGDFRQSVSTWTRQIEALIIAAILGSLLPMLNPKALLRSGTQAKNPVEGWVFAIVSRAFLFGMPLLMFAFFVTENFSGHNERRADRHELVPSHTGRFDLFWRRLAIESTEGKQPSGNLWAMLHSNPLRETLERHLVKRANQFGIDQNELDRSWLDESRTTAELLRFEPFSKSIVNSMIIAPDYLYLHLIVHRLTENFQRQVNQDGDVVNLMLRPLRLVSVMQRYQTRRDQEIARFALTDLLNDAMSDPSFIEKFLEPKDSVHANDHWVDAGDPKRLEELRHAAHSHPENYQEFLKYEPSLGNDIRKLNWQVLQAHYGTTIRSEQTVFATLVAGADQRYRLVWGLSSFGVFVFLGLTLNLNALSLHGFYRWKIGKIWINESPEDGSRIRLSELLTTRKGGPYPLINGAMNLMGVGQSADRNATARFTFSPRFCGSRRTGYVRTDFFGDGAMDLADATAISGAAVNPTSVSNPLARVLLLLLNFRLGQWLPNPTKNRTGKWWSAPLRIFSSWLVWKPEDRFYAFVTDGGHDENTGVGALLERRCRVIIAVDASQDPQYQFTDVMRLIRAAAVEHGVEIVQPGHESTIHTSGCDPLPIERLIPIDKLLGMKTPNGDAAGTLQGLAESHYLVTEIRYPPLPGKTAAENQEKKCYLILIKPNLTGDEPTELLHYRSENQMFPHDPTVDQFYEPRRFACFRQLGEHLGDVLCDELFSEKLWQQSDSNETPWLAERWTPNKPTLTDDGFTAFACHSFAAAAAGQATVSRQETAALGPTPDVQTSVGEWYVLPARPFVDPSPATKRPLPIQALVGSQYSAQSRETVRQCLTEGNVLDREFAADLLRLEDTALPPDPAMVGAAVEDLIAGFAAARSRRDVGFQFELCRVISYYVKLVRQAQEFLFQVSNDATESYEVREFASHLIKTNPRTQRRARRV